MDKESAFGFIGCSRVARTLAQSFVKAGYRVTAATNRRPDAAQAMAAAVPGIAMLATGQAVADACDVVWVTVSDDAIAPVADSIQWNPRHVVLHCSGATELEALRKARGDGARIGGFHPLQSFTDPAVAVKTLPGATVGIEAASELYAALARLAGDIGCRAIEVPAGGRVLYHVSAQYFGALLVALLSEGAGLWKQFGASEEQALAAMLSLAAGTVSAVEAGGLAQGLAGCIARGDVGTVRKHLAALDALGPDASGLYRALSRRAIPLGLARGSLNPQAAEAIGKLVTD